LQPIFSWKKEAKIHMPITRDVVKLPIARQEEIVEQPLGVKEYWFETFRRVIVVPEDDNCFLISVDVYNRQWRFEVEESLELGISRLLYYRPKPNIIFEGVRGIEWCEIVGLETIPEGRREVISFRIRLCGVNLSRDLVWELYRRVVTYIEGRDPAKHPLKCRDDNHHV